jgi:hypothetical protein
MVQLVGNFFAFIKKKKKKKNHHTAPVVEKEFACNTNMLSIVLMMNYLSITNNISVENLRLDNRTLLLV